MTPVNEATLSWFLRSHLELATLSFGRTVYEIRQASYSVFLVNKTCYFIGNRARNFPIWTLQPGYCEELEKFHLVYLNNQAEI